MTTKLSIPTVHLNGTSGEALLEQIADACAALQAAHKALNNAAPHGRDYYVQDDSEFYKARKEHNSRLIKLEAVLTELEYIGEKISDQIVSRTENRR